MVTPQNACVVVLTTMPAGGDGARTLARTLVDRRLAACVNVLPPMDSVYWWQGQVDHGREHQLVIKTTLERVPALEAAMLELHPYEVPELLVMPISEGGEAYLRWLAASVDSRS